MGILTSAQIARRFARIDRRLAVLDRWWIEVEILRSQFKAAEDGRTVDRMNAEAGRTPDPEAPKRKRRR